MYKANRGGRVFICSEYHERQQKVNRLYWRVFTVEITKKMNLFFNIKERIGILLE